MNNKERLALAKRVRKNFQKKNLQFRIIRRAEKIEKELNEKIEKELKRKSLGE